MAEMTPRTTAGRRLAGRLRVIYPAEHQAPLLERDLRDILAIEAEASAEPGALREALDESYWPDDLPFIETGEP